MFRAKTLYFALALVFCSILTAFGQWSAANSGTTNNLNGVHLLDAGVGYVVGDAGTILRTTDAGATWVPVTSGTANALHGVYFFDTAHGVAVGDQGLILRTTNGGNSWQPITSGVVDALRSVAFSGLNGIAGGDSQTILYSTDQGASWQISQTDFFGGGFPGAQMLSATEGIVAGQNSIFSPLFGASTDGGITWNFLSFLFESNEGGCTDVFFFDDVTGVTSGTVFDGRGAIARTTDAGLSWSTLFFDQSIQGIHFAHPVSGFAVGAGGRISHSTDAGVSWTDQISGTSANLNKVSFANDALRGVVVGDGGTILWTKDGGEPGGSPTPTPTASPTPTLTPTATPTPTLTPTATPTATGTPSATPTATATGTPTATPTATATTTATATPTATATGTVTVTPTPRPTPTPRSAPSPRRRPTPPPRPIIS